MDRNYAQAQLVNGVQKSLSARRAWIEISIAFTSIVSKEVALRKESVDRNTEKTEDTSAKRWSLSARRAWIEMPELLPHTIIAALSLSARRAWIEITQCRL